MNLILKRPHNARVRFRPSPQLSGFGDEGVGRNPKGTVYGIVHRKASAALVATIFQKAPTKP